MALSAAAAVHVALFAAVFARLCPDLWRARGALPLTRLDHLWRLLGAAAVSAVGSARRP